MLDIILFSLLSSLVITLVSYMEASASDPENDDTSRFIKLFAISFLANCIGIFVFKNMSGKSI